MNTLDFIEKFKVVAIVRKIYGNDLVCLAHALCDGGIRMIECTFDQRDSECITRTSESIKLLSDEFGDEMCFGAGTVLTAEQVDAACAAGAKYIISPNVNEKVISRTKELRLVSIPGAMTPTEILAAHDMGADIVKLFPAATLGVQYAKDIMAPISHVKLMATGGVNENNFGQFMELGMIGAGVGGRLTDKSVIASGDFSVITERARAFSRVVEKYSH